MSQAYDGFLQTDWRNRTDGAVADYTISDAAGRYSFEEFLGTCGVIEPGHVAGLCRAAASQGVSIIDVLLAQDRRVADDLFRALAEYSGLPFLDAGTGWFRAEVLPDEVEGCLIGGWVRLRGADGRLYIAAAPRDPDARTVHHFEATGAVAEQPIDVLAAPATIRQWIEAAHAPTLTDMAVNGLRRALPAASAHKRLVGWQKVAVAALVLAGLGAALGVAGLNVALVLFLSGMFFLLMVVRLVCLFVVLAGRRRQRFRPIDDRDLPIYTLLVPIYREAGVVGQLTRALMALDYPAAKLDIKLILEAGDNETAAAVARLDLPGCFDVIVVPASLPRTKPKALNYGLFFARGAFVAVYDAEDIPEPAQLRKALAAFAAGPDNLACLQARLGFYNSTRNWLTRQFALEYSALFDVLLPALARLDMPLMLGGTSNHFRTQALENAGGWDPCNVTEDADLGIRFARLGYRCAWLDSITLEEAPTSIFAWLQQRVRWMRGWLQTYLVHMRAPLTTLAQMGFWRFAVFQALVGGLVVSALAHPVFVLYALKALVFSQGFATGQTWPLNTILLVNGINVLVGYGVAMEMGVLGLAQSLPRRLLLQVPLMPFYWLLISVATYWAVWRFIVAPFAWEKTGHRGVARQSAPVNHRLN